MTRSPSFKTEKKEGTDYYCIYSKSQCGRWGAQIKGGAHEYQNKSTAQNPKLQVPPSLLLWREQLVLVVAVVGWLHCCVNHLCVDVAVEGTLTAASTACVLLLGDSRVRQPPLCCCCCCWGGYAAALTASCCCCWCSGDSTAASTAYVLLLGEHGGRVNRLHVVVADVVRTTRLCQPPLCRCWDNAAASTVSVLLVHMECCWHWGWTCTGIKSC